MIINHNMGAINANRLLGDNLGKQAKVLEKLSSGCKINRAGDNAAGLSISEKMRAQIRGLNQSSRNMQDGISLIQTAEGALNEVHSMVQRVRELSVQASNGSNTTEDKNAIQEEINQLVEEVDKIAQTTSFNKINLLDGSLRSEDVESSLARNILNSKGNGTKIVYFEDSNDFVTQKAEAGSATISGHDYLKNLLKTEIVPRAVKSILDHYDGAFGYLKDSSIGIGLKLYDRGDTQTLASVGAGISNRFVEYTLSVNMHSLSFEGGQLTEDSRRNLETTIVHEMIHGFMDEALTNGMVGAVDGVTNTSNAFPKWFKEGMAQTAAGGYDNGNDWVNAGLGIVNDTSESDISTILKKSDHNLTAANKNENSVSQSQVNGIYTGRYGTGYLACMYLGQLESGSSNVTTENLTNGVDSILKKLGSGQSLNNIIKEASGGKYTSVSDFERKFGDADSANFVSKLTRAVGQGNGGLASGDITDNDLLENSPYTIPLFELNTSNDAVRNIYPDDIPVYEGGGSTKTSTVTTPTNPGTTVPTNPGTTPSNPGTTTPTNPGRPTTPGETPISVGGIQIQAGANSGQIINIEIDSVTSQSLGIDSLNVTTEDNAQDSIEKCDDAINKISSIRSTLGAYQNRLEYAKSNVDNAAENTQNAESRIRDTDMASEMMKYSKFNVLVQAAQAMVSQSNQSKESVLRLLQ